MILQNVTAKLARLMFRYAGALPNDLLTQARRTVERAKIRRADHEDRPQSKEKPWQDEFRVYLCAVDCSTFAQSTVGHPTAQDWPVVSIDLVASLSR